MSIVPTKMSPNALVPFRSLPIGAWFVFPQQIDRLVEGDCKPSRGPEYGDHDDRQLAFNVKTGNGAFKPADKVEREEPAIMMGNYGGFDVLVLQVRRPRFIWFHTG